MIKVGIIGASGYGGTELLRLLSSHSKLKVTSLSSVSYLGKNIAEIYPAFEGIIDKTLVDENEVIDNCDVVFAALPHGLSSGIASKCDSVGKILIDLGADFRLESESEYKKWYGGNFQHKELNKKSVYGLPELYRKQIQNSRLIANPGCYPTGAVLGLAPILKNLPFEKNSIIIDAKSGTTGAGRTPTAGTHFPALNENFYPYKIASHRHKPEIEQSIRNLCRSDEKISFTPHLLPVNRGILSTIYVDLCKNISLSELHDLYSGFYGDEYFVRVLPENNTANIRDVRYTNFCDISVHVDEELNRAIIVSAIDNMVKGAAGQAIQNMNIVLGFDEKECLNLIAPSF